MAAAGSNANTTVGGESGGMLVVRGDCAAVMAALTGTSRPRRMADAQADALALLTRIKEACMMPVEFELVPRVRNGAADAVASEAFVIAAELELRSIRAALDDAAGGGDGRQAATEAHCARTNLEGALASLEDPSLASLCGAQTCSDLLLALLDRAEEHGEWELLMRAARALDTLTRERVALERQRGRRGSLRHFDVELAASVSAEAAGLNGLGRTDEAAALVRRKRYLLSRAEGKGGGQGSLEENAEETTAEAGVAMDGGDVGRAEEGEHERGPVLAGGWRGRLAQAVEEAGRTGDIWLAGG